MFILIDQNTAFYHLGKVITIQGCGSISHNDRYTYGRDPFKLTESFIFAHFQLLGLVQEVDSYESSVVDTHRPIGVF